MIRNLALLKKANSALQPRTNPLACVWRHFWSAPSQRKVFKSLGSSFPVNIASSSNWFLKAKHQSRRNSTRKYFWWINFYFKPVWRWLLYEATVEYLLDSDSPNRRQNPSECFGKEIFGATSLNRIQRNRPPGQSLAIGVTSVSLAKVHPILQTLKPRAGGKKDSLTS